MAYANGNLKTKKQLKEWVANGRQVNIFNPSGMFPTVKDGRTTVEGPHYPTPHTWYANVVMKDGVITSVK